MKRSLQTIYTMNRASQAVVYISNAAGHYGREFRQVPDVFICVIMDGSTAADSLNEESKRTLSEWVTLISDLVVRVYGEYERSKKGRQCLLFLCRVVVEYLSCLKDLINCPHKLEKVDEICKNLQG